MSNTRFDVVMLGRCFANGDLMLYSGETKSDNDVCSFTLFNMPGTTSGSRQNVVEQTLEVILNITDIDHAVDIELLTEAPYLSSKRGLATANDACRVHTSQDEFRLSVVF